jgi:hypothetical protein
LALASIQIQLDGNGTGRNSSLEGGPELPERGGIEGWMVMAIGKRKQERSLGRLASTATSSRSILLACRPAPSLDRPSHSTPGVRVSFPSFFFPIQTNKARQLALKMALAFSQFALLSRTRTLLVVVVSIYTYIYIYIGVYYIIPWVLNSIRYPSQSTEPTSRSSVVFFRSELLIQNFRSWPRGPRPPTVQFQLCLLYFHGPPSVDPIASPPAQGTSARLLDSPRPDAAADCLQRSEFFSARPPPPVTGTPRRIPVPYPCVAQRRQPPSVGSFLIFSIRSSIVSTTGGAPPQMSPSI